MKKNVEDHKNKLAVMKKIDIVNLINVIKNERNDARSTLRSFKITDPKKDNFDDDPNYNYFRGRVESYNSILEFLGYRKSVDKFKKGRKPGKKKVKEALQKLDININTFNLKNSNKNNVRKLLYPWLYFTMLTFRFIDELFNDKQKFYIKKLSSFFSYVEENWLHKNEKITQSDLEKLKKIMFNMKKIEEF